MPRILLEDCQGEFIADRSAIQLFPVTESSKPLDKLAEIPGRLSVAGVVNGNNRRYKRGVWENNLKEGSSLSEAIKNCSAFGTLEHPESGKVDLTSPISHVVTEAKLNGDEVHGSIRVLNTFDGKKLLALIEGGYNPLVSSRGFGTLSKAQDGVDEVEDDYICEGWDVVKTPSFKQAQLLPKRDQPIAAEPAPAPAASGTQESQAPRPAPVAATPSPAPAATKLNESTPPKKIVAMDANQIRENLSRVASADIAKLTPARLSEAVSSLRGLHTEVAKFQAEDATRSWEATQLHREIEEAENAFAEAAKAPSKQVAKLQEDNTKLLRVSKAMGQVAINFKKGLTESAQKLEKKDQLVGEVARRGRSWMKKCESLQKQVAFLEEKYATSTLALDYMREEYHSDVAELGRRVIELEFPEAVKDTKIAEALKAANKPGKVSKVRESILKTAKEGKTVTESQEKKEGKKAPAPAPAKKDEPKVPVEEGKVEEGVQILRNVVNPRNINESVAMAIRLGKSNALVEA